MAGADPQPPEPARGPAEDATPTSEGSAPSGAEPAAGPRRPAFANSFPRDPALDRLVDLFEQGNYAAVRAGAPAVLAASENTAVRSSVKELQKRMDPDPISVGLVVIAACLLATLAGWYWSHPHEAAPPHPVPAPAPVSS